MSGQEQQQITAETNLTETTVAELKAQIKELQAKNAGYAEQLSLLQNQPPVAEVQAEEVDMDALRAEIRAEMEIQGQADDKMVELNQKERDEAIKAAQKARAELEEMQRAAAAAAQAHAEELTKTRRQAEETAARLNMAADESTVRFGLLFDQLQDAAGKVLDLADAVQQGGETEKAGKFRAALHKALLAWQMKQMRCKMMEAFAAGVRLGIFLLGAGVGLIGALTIGLGIIAFAAWLAECLKHNRRE